MAHLRKEKASLYIGMRGKGITPEDDDNNLDIQIKKEFIRLDDDDKQKVIDHIRAMLSTNGEAEKPD